MGTAHLVLAPSACAEVLALDEAVVTERRVWRDNLEEVRERVQASISVHPNAYRFARHAERHHSDPGSARFGRRSQGVACLPQRQLAFRELETAHAPDEPIATTCISSSWWYSNGDCRSVPCSTAESTYSAPRISLISRQSTSSAEYASGKSFRLCFLDCRLVGLALEPVETSRRTFFAAGAPGGGDGGARVAPVVGVAAMTRRVDEKERRWIEGSWRRTVVQTEARMPPSMQNSKLKLPVFGAYKASVTS